MLIVGSAAGVIAMSKIANLTFLSYMRFFHYLLWAYSVGFALVWLTGQLFFS